MIIGRAARNKYIIQEYGETVDEYGNTTPGWTDLVSRSVWKAERKDEQPMEKIQADRVDAKVSLVLEGWYRSDLTTDMRLREGGTEANPDEVYSIHGITPQSGILKTMQVLVTKE